MPLFGRFQDISNLRLNLRKCVIVPLWPIDFQDLRAQLVACCSAAQDFVIAECARYLGTFLGLRAGPPSWAPALRNYYDA
eukprot:2522147-Lingulodinium_polyedra.AAC.1